MIILKFDLVSIGEAAGIYGVSVPTMRRWDREGKLKSYSRALGDHRRYKFNVTEKVKVGYARVSSHDQKKGLATQAKFLSQFSDVVLEDLGSGLNGKLQSKKALSKLYIADNKDRIKSLEKTVLSLNKKAVLLDKTGGCRIRSAKFRFKAHQKFLRLTIVKQRLAKLQSEQDFKINSFE
jgi:DNA-binding transcriptional MerR regulator